MYKYGAMLLHSFPRMLALFSTLALSSASAAILTYTGSLSGFQQVPANVSSATGFAVIDYNDILSTLTVNVTFSGLSAGTTAGHIHCCAAEGANAGVAIGFPASPGFPLGVTSGTYNNVFDLTSIATFNGTFFTNNGGTVALAEAAFLNGLNSGQTYVNIHNINFPSGEIRGQLAPVPEPATILVLCSGLGFLAWRKRR